MSNTAEFTARGEIHYRRAEFRKGTSDKFYEVRVFEEKEDEFRWEFRWGRIGAAGQTKTGNCASETSAKNMANGQLIKKLDKGYVEVPTTPLYLLASETQTPDEREKDTGLGPSGLEVPTEWAMYTAAGNRRMAKFAAKYVEKLDLIRASWGHKKGQLSGDAYRKQIEALLKQYVKEWGRIGSGKQYREASDTAVREVVGGFFDQLREKSGIDTWDLISWNDVY